MSSNLYILTILSFAVSPWFFPSQLIAQAPKNTPGPGSDLSLTAEKAIGLAEQGRCKEAIPALKRAVNLQGPAEQRKKAGVLGLRCSLTLDSRDAALDFARALGHQFPQDPEILFILVHAY